MTAAATTGPKSEPRPTSSTPATKCAPDCQAFFSKRSVQRSFLRRRSLAADGERGFWDGDLPLRGTGDKAIFAEIWIRGKRKWKPFASPEWPNLNDKLWCLATLQRVRMPALQVLWHGRNAGDRARQEQGALPCGLDW